MDQWTVFDEIKSGTLRSVYFFYGPEAYIRRSAVNALIARAVGAGPRELNMTALASPGAREIVESCETLPMLSERRVVLVRGLALLSSGKAKDEAQDSQTLCEYLPRVPETTCLVFDADGAIDRRKKLTAALLKLPGAVAFEALDDAQLFRWMGKTLRPLGKRMGREACEHLAFCSGRDLTALSGELEKLAAYAGGREEITAEDVELVATHTAECTVFAMVDALCERRAAEAFRLLGVLLQGGEQRIGILAMITRQYRQLTYLSALRARGTPQAETAKLLGVPPFALGRLSRQLGGRSFETLRGALALCVQADYDVKRGALREDAALERLMLRLLEV